MSTKSDVLLAAVVPNEEAAKYSSDGGDDAAVKASKRADPELFQLSLTGVRPGDRLRVSVTWFQPLNLVNGQYTLRVTASRDSCILDLPCFRLSCWDHHVLIHHLAVAGNSERLAYGAYVGVAQFHFPTGTAGTMGTAKHR